MCSASTEHYSCSTTIEWSNCWTFSQWYAGQVASLKKSSSTGQVRPSQSAGPAHRHCNGALLHKSTHSFAATRLSTAPVHHQALGLRCTQGCAGNALPWCASAPVIPTPVIPSQQQHFDLEHMDSATFSFDANRLVALPACSPGSVVGLSSPISSNGDVQASSIGISSPATSC